MLDKQHTARSADTPFGQGFHAERNQSLIRVSNTLKTLLPQSLFRRDIDPARYRLEIDGLRFFAIMIVMVGHLLERIEKFWLSPNANLDQSYINGLIEFFASQNQGGLLFFGISGFLISKRIHGVRDGRSDRSFGG